MVAMSQDNNGTIVLFDCRAAAVLQYAPKVIADRFSPVVRPLVKAWIWMWILSGGELKLNWKLTRKAIRERISGVLSP
jgi:hypothetical protein